MNSSSPVRAATDESASADDWLQPDDWLSPLAPGGDRATEYALRVTQGKVVAGPDVRNACKRHLHDLEHGAKRGLTYSHHAAGYAFRFFENILRLSEGQFEGTPFKLHESQAFIVGCIFGWLRLDGTRRFRRAYVEQGKGNGKALDITTPIATPQGFKAMGDLVVGDSVFDERGIQCLVTGVTPVMQNHECYRVVFSDGAEIVADAEHLWVTSAMRTGLPKGPKVASAARKGAPAIRTTAEIARTLIVPPSKSKHPQAQWNHRVAVAGALSVADAALPVPPYTLGAWLGDGDSDCARITCAERDWAIVESIRADGFGIVRQKGHSEHVARVSLRGLQNKLRGAGILGNKHIPHAYLWASPAQRLALLQGLMDTDGTIGADGQAELTFCNPRVAFDALQLIRSLGLKSRVRASPAMLDGRKVGTRYRMQFTAHSGMPVFRLARKAARQKAAPASKPISSGRMIVACERVPSVPVRCISVSSPSRMYLAGEALVPTHNSPLAGGVGLYGLVADKEAGAQVYAAAAKREQAGILFADAVKMVKQSPKLSGKLKFSGGEGREFNIAHHPSQSFFRPVSRDTGKTGSGPRPYFVLADEVHELPDRAILEMLERGFKFRRAPLLFMITNSGSNRNSVAWEEHEHAVKCAAGSIDAVTDHTFVGDVIDDTTFSYVCSLDDGDDPLKDPSCWIKANPLLGITIQVDYLHEAVAQARAIPGKLNGILRLHFCKWTEAETAWMTRETLDPCLADFDPWELHKGKPCWIGLDLSQSRDITAMACLVRTGETKTGPTFDLWVEAWTPKDTMEARELRDKMPYAVWVAQKHLHAPPGENINYLHVAQTVIEYSRHFDVQLVAYDRFAFKAFEEQFGDAGSAVTLRFAEHPQGGMKKGKPLEGSETVNEETGEKEKQEGLWMPGSVRLFEDALLEKRIRIKRNPVMVSAMLSAVIEEDKWGNHWLAKTRSTNKIDCAVAGAMAVGASEKTAVREPEYDMFFI